MTENEQYLRPNECTRLEAARAATRGCWIADREGCIITTPIDEQIAGVFDRDHITRPNAKHIAANDPATVESTLLELGRLRGLVVAYFQPKPIYPDESLVLTNSLREAVEPWLKQKAGEQ